jgi:hypothetical protein
MSLIEFNRNYRDLSTDAGFQFEFYCDRCGNGHQTRFEASTTGTITNVLDAASNLLGGMFGSAANAARNVHSVAWEKAHDAAFEKAVTQTQELFKKCKRCGKWVDNDCWNTQRVLCKDCAPDLQEEFSSIQVEAARYQAREAALNVPQVTEEAFKQTVVGVCPHCNANVSGGKFCPECGKSIAADKFCAECGAKVKAEAKFCQECGSKQS